MWRAREPIARLLPLLVLYLAVCALAQPGPAAVRDEPDLLAAAARMLEGQLVGHGDPVYPRAYLWHGPGLVALLAPLVAVDLPLRAIRFVEPLLLFAAVLLFHRLLRVRLAPRPALAWTFALGLYAPFATVLGVVHKEPLSVLLVVAGTLALTRALQGAGGRYVAGAGLALSGLTMVRLEYGWVALALLAAALVHWARRRTPGSRRLVAIGAVAVGGCVPWLATTYAMTGEPLYWGTSSGLSLYWMSPTAPPETGQWHSPQDVARNPELAVHRPLFARVARLEPVAADRLLRRRAVANIRARPLRYVRNVAANASRLFFFVPARPARPAATLALFAAFNGVLLAALAWSATVLFRRRGGLPPETGPIALFTALAIAVHLPASASPRLLLAFVPTVVWLVVCAAVPAGQAPPSASR